MMKDISEDEARLNGIKSFHSVLENGEKRFRQVCLKDNTSYSRTESGNTLNGYWQKSHYHKYSRELYIVQKGEIIFAEFIDEKLKLTRVKENEICKTEINIPHNVYMFPNTVIHTVKYGDIKEIDWNDFSKLDILLEDVNIENI